MTPDSARAPYSAIIAAKRLVIKIGSSLVTDEGRGLDHEAIYCWAAQIARLKDLGKQVALVSSGAIAESMQRLGWYQRPKEIEKLQAAACSRPDGLGARLRKLL